MAEASPGPWGIVYCHYVVVNIEMARAAFVGPTDDVMWWNAALDYLGRQHDNVASIPPSVFVGCAVESVYCEGEA